MHPVLRYLMLLALVVWVGGIIFFSFGVAPVLFAVLPSTAWAGAVINRSLTILHWMGLVSGAVFLLCSIFFSRRSRMAVGLVMLMMALTGISQFGVIPRMEPLRSSLHPAAVAAAPAGQEHDKAQANAEAEFNRLHQLSVGMEAATLFCGLLALGSLSRNAWGLD